MDMKRPQVSVSLTTCNYSIQLVCLIGSWYLSSSHHNVQLQLYHHSLCPPFLWLQLLTYCTYLQDADSRIHFTIHHKMTKSAGMLIVHSTRAFASFSLFTVKLDDSFDHNIVILNAEKVYHEVCSSLGWVRVCLQVNNQDYIKRKMN